MNPFVEMLSNLAGRVATVGRAEVDRYADWARAMAAKAQGWAAMSATGATCICRLPTPQGLAMCGAPAVASCCICSSPCCLKHVFVSTTQDVCGACVASARVIHGARQVPPPPRQEPAFTRGDALKLLGLKDGADADAIRSQYKKLAVRWHPDKAKNDSDREKRTARLKDINRAYQFLMADPQKKAA